MRSVRIVVTGRVQGVGYRAFVARQADNLGLAGWVRNQPDGSVEAFAAGRADRLDAFVAALRRGPAHSRVEDVRTEWLDTAEGPEGFRVTG
jgi:acylphosphatase